MPASSGAGREEGTGAQHPGGFTGRVWDPVREPDKRAEGNHL